MPTLTVDGISVEVPPGSNVLQACEAAGVEIPRFCYHERLSIAGNCRMCLVEQVKAPKPIASCAMPAAEGMVIKTNTPMVRKARQGVMEFLLINHPLDCPICDQGGECDLQDQAMAYGFDHSRYQENKRAVTEKYMGALIKTQMTRCIHCTRCVRFSTEVAGTQEMGAIGRGEDMEITSLEEAVLSELSGNVIDLCPVGALTAKPHAFSYRAWELRNTSSVDVHDALGSSIRIDARGAEVIRVLPRVNDDVNEEWISDKTRFAVDGLKKRRLDRPYVRQDGKLVPASWNEAFAVIGEKLAATQPAKVAGLIGDLAGIEEIKALKDLLRLIGSGNIDCRVDGSSFDVANRASYLFNSGLAGVDQADAILLVGANPRVEASVLNARIRKRYLTGKVKIAVIGMQTDLTYKADWLGTGTDALSGLVSGEGPFLEVLKGASHPMVIVGSGVAARPDAAAIFALIDRLGQAVGLVSGAWNGFNVLHLAASRVGALDVGAVPSAGGLDTLGILSGAASGAVEVLYLLGVDDIDTTRLGNSFVIYQGSHGDAGAHRADVILPGAAYTEKNATYVNTEGRVQRGQRAIFPPGDAREDWAILRALSGVLGKPLPYDSLTALRAKIAVEVPHLARIDTVTTSAWAPIGKAGELIAAVPFLSPISDFYQTNPIARASTTMAECSALHAAAPEAATGTHG